MNVFSLLILPSVLSLLALTACANDSNTTLRDILPTTVVPPTVVPVTPVILSMATPVVTLTSVVPSSTALPVPTLTRTLTPTRTRTPTPYPIPTGSITRIDTRFRSAALQQDRRILIYLPPGYNTQTQRRYPVLYMLHGWGGFDKPTTTEWEQWGLKDRAQELMLNGKIQPMIIVQPDGFMPDTSNSLYFNHGPGTDGKVWGDYIWRDVVNYVDANYRTLRQSSSRAIGGFSFGGQGALSLSLTHPDVFQVVGAHSPSFRGADGSLPFINDWNWFNQFDPIWLVQNTNHAKQLTLWMDVALNDEKVRHCGAESNRCVEAFHALLVSKGIVHEWQDQWQGTHEGYTYWMHHIVDYLPWYAQNLAGQPR